MRARWCNIWVKGFGAHGLCNTIRLVITREHNTMRERRMSGTFSNCRTHSHIMYLGTLIMLNFFGHIKLFIYMSIKSCLRHWNGHQMRVKAGSCRKRKRSDECTNTNRLIWEETIFFTETSVVHRAGPNYSIDVKKGTSWHFPLSLGAQKCMRWLVNHPNRITTNPTSSAMSLSARLWEG